MNHSPDSQSCTPPPLPVASTPAIRQARAFPWGFACLWLLLNLVGYGYTYYILPKYQDIYAQLGWNLPLPQRMFTLFSPLIFHYYSPFGIAFTVVLILLYQRWVMAKPWRKWVLLTVAVLLLGMVYLSVANVSEGMAIFKQEQRKARGY